MSDTTMMKGHEKIRYMMNKGLKCPFCESESIDTDTTVVQNSGDMTKAHQVMRCLSCGGEWVDRYELADVEVLSTGDGGE